jgi:hypothetical protein
MKNSMRLKTTLSAGVALLAIALTSRGASDKSLIAEPHLNVSGALHGQETDLLQGSPPEKLLVKGEISGLATHWGTFEMSYKVTVKLPEGSSVGTAQLRLPNGDTIFTKVAGLGRAFEDVPTLNNIVEVNTIEGGTGQFAGARGTLVVDRLVDLSTGLSEGSIHGLVITPAASH